MTIAKMQNRVEMQFDDLRELTNEEIDYFRELAFKRFDANINPVDYEIKEGIDRRSAHLLFKEHTSGFVFIEGLSRAAVISSRWQEKYARRGAEIIRTYSFTDVREAGFMWGAQK